MSYPIRTACAILMTALAAAAVCAGTSDIVVQDSATGKIYCRSARFLIPFEAADSGPSGIAAVRLYYTTDGGATWIFFAEKAEMQGSFQFIAPADGVYGFTVDAVDKAGNIEHKDAPTSGKKPEINVVIDTKAPQLETVFPRQDMELVPGPHLRVRFRAGDQNLAPSTAMISVRKDGDGTWVDLPNVTYQDAEFFAQGEVLFAGTYQVRLSVADRAGNVASETYTFTATPNAKPAAKQQGPMGQDWELRLGAAPRAKSLTFDIDYKVEDIGGQPPAAVGLWYTTDGGATWEFYGLDPDVTSPFRFQAPREGIYGFKLTATTRSGISEPAPKPGIKPDISTLVDVTFPTLMLDDPRGGESYAGGDVHYVKWTARDEHFGSLPISLLTARDGGDWELMAADLPNTGAYGWNVPFIEYATYRLKIEARDLVGNTTSVVSDTFFVVSVAAEARILTVTPVVASVGIKQIEEPGTRPAPKPEVVTPEPTPPAPVKTDDEIAAIIDRATGMRLRGDYEGAEAALREAAKFDKENVTAKNELGAILIQEGRHADAVSVLKEARALDPKDGEVLYNLASAYYALGSYKEAAAAFETLYGIDGKNEAALWNLAKSYYAANDVSRARATWQKIVSLNLPGSPFVERAGQALAAVPEPVAKK